MYFFATETTFSMTLENFKASKPLLKESNGDYSKDALHNTQNSEKLQVK